MNEQNYDIYLEERISEVAASVEHMQQRMDFFEAIVLKLLVGLKDAGIIVESEDTTDTVDVTDGEI